MKLSDLVNGMRDAQKGADLSDGSLTTDKSLLSLRRQKRLMDERAEKERLKAELRRRAMADDKKAFTSSSMREDKTILDRLPKNKEKRFLSAKNNIFS
jgi:hypothetical protein